MNYCMEIVTNEDYHFIKQDWKRCVFASKNGLKIMCMTKLSTFASSMLSHVCWIHI